MITGGITVRALERYNNKEVKDK